MANSQLALKLLLVAVAIGSVFSEDLQCAQCVSGNFVSYIINSDKSQEHHKKAIRLLRVMLGLAHFEHTISCG